jgi:hypothetical protein
MARSLVRLCVPMVGVVLASGWLAGCTSGPTTTASPGPGGPTPPTSFVAAPSAEHGLGLDWTEGTVEQPIEPGASGATQAPVFCSPCHASQETSLAGVAANGSTLVAVGIQFPPPRAAVWLSTDGLTWQRVGGLQAPEGSLMEAVAWTPHGFVAVGGLGSAAAAWTSPDGRTWTPASVQSPTVAGTARMDAVAPAQGRLVAAGDVGSTVTPGRAEVWTSTDGQTWATSDDAPSFSGATISGLAADASLVVAVGSVADADGRRSATTWSSVDGRSWMPGALDPSFAGAQILAVTTGGPGFVAVGTADGGLRAAAWTSADGVHWTAAAPGTGSTNYGQRIAMTGVTRVGTTLVAGGQRDSAGNGSSVVWVSADGSSWRRVPDPASFGGAEMTAITAGASGLVAVGATGLPDNWASAAWFDPFAGR